MQSTTTKLEEELMLLPDTSNLENENNIDQEIK